LHLAGYTSIRNLPSGRKVVDCDAQAGIAVLGWVKGSALGILCLRGDRLWSGGFGQ